MSVFMGMIDKSDRIYASKYAYFHIMLCGMALPYKKSDQVRFGSHQTSLIHGLICHSYKKSNGI